MWNDRFILIFGGREKDRFYLDCWEYDTVEKTIRLLAGTDQAPMSPSPQPPSRAHHTTTLVGDVVYLIGGSGKDGLVTDVWCFHIKTSSWEKPQLS